MLTLDQIRVEFRPLLAPRIHVFQCGDGWSELLSQTLADLRRATPNARVVQVKEKLGTLRVILADKLDPAASAIVRRAEVESATICDRCGEAGRLISSDGYVRTRCLDHEDRP